MSRCGSNLDLEGRLMRSRRGSNLDLEGRLMRKLNDERSLQSKFEQVRAVVQVLLVSEQITDFM